MNIKKHIETISDVLMGRDINTYEYDSEDCRPIFIAALVFALFIAFVMQHLNG